jgi:HD-GYP domain-containing protein (c-di-GMP phosphodiesterase class II)
MAANEPEDRMALLAGALGVRMKLDPVRVRILREAMLMHDVGEIGTIAMVLRKQGSLSEEERHQMERHTIIGHEIFAGSESEPGRMSATIALTHHECFDGSGYPHGLVGEAIPIEGRIAAVADVFDALISSRSHREPLGVAEAVLVIEEGRNTRFDPAIVDALLDYVGMA